MRSIRLLTSVLLVAAACGDDGNKGTVDAPSEPVIDAAPDAPVTPVNCDYTEQADATNDDFSGNVANGVPEATGKTFTSTTTTICGKLDSGHFIAADQLVDIDGFVFAASGEVDVRIDLTLTGTKSVDYLSLNVYTGPNLSDDVGTTAKFEGDHAVLDVHLSPVAGMFEILVFAGNPTATTAPISYVAKISIDQPATRCPKSAAAATYTEQRDTTGNGHRGNDMVLIGGTPPQMLTTDTTDLAEPTGVTVAPATSYHLVGSSADIAAINAYKDRDTFEFTTGPSTNELAVRLNWPGTVQDLDYYVFPKDTVPMIGRSITAMKREDEFKTFAVKPGTAYWVLVGNDPSSLAGAAVPYDVTLCGAAFAP
ncbi:hypothetical protein BH11MYX3_BH11MYX3_19340 [soil metagenome]